MKSKEMLRMRSTFINTLTALYPQVEDNQALDEQIQQKFSEVYAPLDKEAQEAERNLLIRLLERWSRDYPVNSESAAMYSDLSFLLT